MRCSYGGMKERWTRFACPFSIVLEGASHSSRECESIKNLEVNGGRRHDWDVAGALS